MNGFSQLLHITDSDTEDYLAKMSQVGKRTTLRTQTGQILGFAYNLIDGGKTFRSVDGKLLSSIHPTLNGFTHKDFSGNILSNMHVDINGQLTARNINGHIQFQTRESLNGYSGYEPNGNLLFEVQQLNETLQISFQQQALEGSLFPAEMNIHEQLHSTIPEGWDQTQNYLNHGFDQSANFQSYEHSYGTEFAPEFGYQDMIQQQAINQQWHDQQLYQQQLFEQQQLYQQQLFEQQQYQQQLYAEQLLMEQQNQFINSNHYVAQESFYNEEDSGGLFEIFASFFG